MMTSTLWLSGRNIPSISAFTNHLFFNHSKRWSFFFQWDKLKTILGSVYNEEKDAKEIACCKRVLVPTVLINIAVNDFDAKKSAHYKRMYAVTKLIVSRTSCNSKGNSRFCSRCRSCCSRRWRSWRPQWVRPWTRVGSWWAQWRPLPSALWVSATSNAACPPAPSPPSPPEGCVGSASSTTPGNVNSRFFKQFLIDWFQLSNAL